ncbi:cytochrome c551 [Sporosarcina jiandibaonis]|uniref:cytochrome c551 n=1 Tax=Sporosarcina jiandibaonis TaxID=2715535 RepID=UPI0015522AE9
MKKKLLAAIFASLLVLGACGGGGNTANDGDKDTSGDVASVDAEKIVNNKCISCHGNNLEGGGAPALNNIGSKLSETEIHDIIINGQGGMPGGLIKGEEAEAVSKWLAEKK